MHEFWEKSLFPDLSAKKSKKPNRPLCQSLSPSHSLFLALHSLSFLSLSVSLPIVKDTSSVHAESGSMGKSRKKEVKAKRGDSACSLQQPLRLQDMIDFGHRVFFPPRDVTCTKTQYPNRIMTVGGFLQTEECEALIDWAEGKERAEGAEGSEGSKGESREGTEDQGGAAGAGSRFLSSYQAQSRDYAHRDTGRVQLNDAEFAAQLFQRLRPFLPPLGPLSPLGCSANIRLYRYCRGQRFGKHVDEAHEDEALGGSTHFTVLVYLNGTEGCVGVRSVATGAALSQTQGTGAQEAEAQGVQAQDTGAQQAQTQGVCDLLGGETIFYAGIYGHKLLSVSPERGLLLLHGHGAHCLTHEGAEVTRGVKYLLRTDVVYG
jgi:hypothetical protein